MDLKQKYENAKAKLKEHAPAIATVSSVIAVAATSVAALTYAVSKKQDELIGTQREWIRGHKEFGICNLSEEEQEQLKEGRGALMFNYGSSDDNYCLMYCDETHTDGKHGN